MQNTFTEFEYFAGTDPCSEPGYRPNCAFSASSSALNRASLEVHVIITSRTSLADGQRVFFSMSIPNDCILFMNEMFLTGRKTKIKPKHFTM